MDWKQSASLSRDELSALHAIFSNGPEIGAVEKVEAILDRHVLLNVDINTSGQVTVSRGQAGAQLVEQGWRTFLIRVTNQASATSVLKIQSAQAEEMGRVSNNDPAATQDFSIGAVDAVVAESRWIALRIGANLPFNRRYLAWISSTAFCRFIAATGAGGRPLCKH